MEDFNYQYSSIYHLRFIHLGFKGGTLLINVPPMDPLVPRLMMPPPRVPRLKVGGPEMGAGLKPLVGKPPSPGPGPSRDGRAPVPVLGPPGPPVMRRGPLGTGRGGRGGGRGDGPRARMSVRLGFVGGRPCREFVGRHQMGTYFFHVHLSPFRSQVIGKTGVGSGNRTQETFPHAHPPPHTSKVPAALMRGVFKNIDSLVQSWYTDRRADTRVFPHPYPPTPS